MEEAVYKGVIDAEGVLKFPVNNIHVQIRLWTAGPPRGPTDWYVVWGDFTRRPNRERVSGNHRNTLDSGRDTNLTNIGKRIEDFGVQVDGVHNLHMDITVPQIVIDQLESR
jgi:hypothetical protein